jgi:dTDP-glucose pyrophosphorylase
MTERLKLMLISEAANIRAALIAIDQGAAEIALVVVDENRLLGTLTDGDLRRAMIGGASLEDRASMYMRRSFTSVGEQTTRAEVLDLMRAHTLAQIPVLDGKGRLVGLHLLQEIVGNVERPNWAVIMAGGRGERLRPLTDAIPKPMIRVAGRPILERLVLHLAGFGIRRIFISVNYMAHIIESHFGDGSTLGCHIEYLREKEPLGTGGAISLLQDSPEDPFLVLNGDLVTQWDVGRMLAFHRDGGYKATVGVHDYVHTIPYGVIETRGDKVALLREKPTATWLANAGVYVLDPELVARVPKGVHFPLPALVEECIERHEAVGAFRIEEDWTDVGQPPDLNRARGEVDEP